MFHSRIINNKNNRLDERCMLATVMFKVYRSMYPTIFSELFRRRDIFCNSQNNNNFAAPIAKSAFHGSESISYLGPKIWMLYLWRSKSQCLQKGYWKMEIKKLFLQARKAILIKSRFHFKYFRNLFLTVMLSSTYLRLLFPSILPENIENFCLLNYSVRKARNQFLWSELKIFLFKVFNLLGSKLLSINICMVDIN